MKCSIATFALVGFFLWISPVFAEMTSTNFKIRWDSLTTGGSDSSSSTNYGLRDTLGNASVESMNSTNYQVAGGYRAGVFDQILTFSMLVQDTSNGRSVTSRSGLTYFAANTSGVSVGDYVALIQDLGANQISATGKVASISSNTSITVDSWSDNGTTPSIDSLNDYYYPMNASSIAFGTLGDTSVTTGIIGFEVTADDPNGYVVQIQSDGNLSIGGHDITNVSDGSVTAGSEEYGVRSSDTSLSNSTFDTADTAISTSYQDVTSESTTKFNDRHFVVLKASRTNNTPSGNYSQTISLIASGNF